MSTTASQHHILDTRAARIVAGLLAAAIATIFFMTWADQVKELATPAAEKPLAVAPAMSPAEPAPNPALMECLKQRLDDVDRMKNEGIINDMQHQEFRRRAEAVCRGQHPN